MALPVSRGRPEDAAAQKALLQTHQKLREIAERGGCNMNLEARQALDHGIEIERGGIWLEPLEEQSQKLWAPLTPPLLCFRNLSLNKRR